MIALFALLCAAAPAADVWLSGGLSATPTTADLLVPSWRLGAGLGRVNPWFTVSYASFDTALFGGDLDGFVLQPRVGARIDLGDPARTRPVSFIGITGATRIFNLSTQDDSWVEDAEAEASFPPWGVGLTGGLDAPINDALSLSAEIGAEYSHVRYALDGDIVTLALFDTLAAVYVNLWL